MHLVATDLRAGYAGVPALHGVSIEIRGAEIVALIGRNGVGKTTLVKALMGLLPATDGRLELNGENITRLATSQRVRRGVRAVYQEQPLFTALTVAENLRVLGFGPRQRHQVLEMFDGALAERDTQRAGTLSGGEQKMLAAACALRAGARLLLMDEPGEGLQPANIDRLAGHLEQAREGGSGILLVEQHLALAERLADRFLVMEKGEIVESVDADDSDLHARVSSHLVI